jgi:hypothetical protein
MLAPALAIDRLAKFDNDPVVAGAELLNSVTC